VIRLVVLLALFASGCSCWTNDENLAVSADKYALERDAACEVVPGCEPAFMRAVSVYEAPAERIPELCHDEEAEACFCVSPLCNSIILEEGDRNAAIHEWTHAALESIGAEHDHTDLFWQAFRAAGVRAANKRLTSK
jgi:hypothetical protein